MVDFGVFALVKQNVAPQYYIDANGVERQVKLIRIIHEPTGKPVGLIFKINLIGTTCKTDRISLALSE